MAERDTFTLDTSGCVVIDGVRVGWDAGAAPFHLSPFAQGYIEAAMADLYRRTDREADERGDPPVSPTSDRFAFYRVAPETLAAMLKDCEAVHRLYPGWTEQGAGRQFWRDRQGGLFRTSATRERFPPVTLHLGDDGLIYFGEAA